MIRDGERVSARVDDRSIDLRVSQPESGVFVIHVDGQVWETAVSENGPNTFGIRLKGQEMSVRLFDPKRLRGSVAEGDASAGKAEIRTAMPGKVVRLLKKFGETVTKGEGMIVVEAMKMQNEMRAPKDGTIGQIKVVEGDTVAAGDVLVVID